MLCNSIILFFLGARNLFLWLLAVVVTVYVLDSVIFGSETDELGPDEDAEGMWRRAEYFDAVSAVCNAH